MAEIALYHHAQELALAVHSSAEEPRHTLATLAEGMALAEETGSGEGRKRGLRVTGASVLRESPGRRVVKADPEGNEFRETRVEIPA